MHSFGTTWLGRLLGTWVYRSALTKSSNENERAWIGMHMVLTGNRYYNYTPNSASKGPNEKQFSPTLDNPSTLVFTLGLEITNLDKSNGLRLLAEALTTKIEAVFTDKTSLVGAKPAVEGVHPVSHSKLLLERPEMLTTDDYPFQTFLDVKTKLRRVSFV